MTLSLTISPLSFNPEALNNTARNAAINPTTKATLFNPVSNFSVSKLEKTIGRNIVQDGVLLQ